MPGRFAIVLTDPEYVINACEKWVATASALYLSHALVADASEPYSLRHLLDSFVSFSIFGLLNSFLLHIQDFYIIPVPNPDGYDYTWERDRFW